MTEANTSRNCVRIRLEPYAVDMLTSADADNLVPSRLGDVGWCSLPDTLYMPVSREFVGLSFPVDAEHQAFARRIAEAANDSRVRFLARSDPEFSTRYVGFGDASRLELCWQRPDGEVECEAASLFDGFWFEDAASPAGADPMAMIRGYCLLGLDEVAQDHRLTVPSHIG